MCNVHTAIERLIKQHAIRRVRPPQHWSNSGQTRRPPAAAAAGAAAIRRSTVAKQWSNNGQFDHCAGHRPDASGQSGQTTAAIKRWTGARHLPGARAACDIGSGWVGGWVIDRSAPSPRRAARLRMTRMVRETVSVEWARNRAVSTCSAGGRRSPPSRGARLGGPREAAGGAAARRNPFVAAAKPATSAAKPATAAAPEELRRASGLLATGRNLSSQNVLAREFVSRAKRVRARRVEIEPRGRLSH